ncbi:hypothetical protein JR316_0004197 [Psilocybe cubensis]|uniref:Uncharacterized protein n=2 Tax=Psilocybe cubensis TaxID=181762 RepID=A0A8H7XVX9_PSICU|nr:hypothetical protein JR316_0004197 [Psilocybe cubensis]KAH9482102.1 hypothetical protein JR316_0004197 [Psilocybe cubensis]
MYQPASSNSTANNTQQADAGASESPSSTVIAALFISELLQQNSKETELYFFTLVRCISNLRSEVKNTIQSLTTNGDDDDVVVYGALLLLLRCANSKSRFHTSMIDGYDLFRTAYTVALKAFADNNNSIAGSYHLLMTLPSFYTDAVLFAQRGSEKKKAKYTEIMKNIRERMESDVTRSSDTIRGMIVEFRGILEDDFATKHRRTRFGYPRKFEAV